MPIKFYDVKVNDMLSKSLIRAKFFAMLIHVCLSLLIFAAIVAWMLLKLYPSFYFSMSGGWQGLMLMAGVDVVIGPLITLLIFNPNKKRREVISDLLIIAVVQFAALGYGIHTVYQERPKLAIIYNNSSAAVLNARELAEDEQLAKVDLNQLSRLEGIPIAGLHVRGTIKSYDTVQQSLDVVEQADKLSRQTAAKNTPQVQAELVNLEKQHGKLYMLSMMGKYTGAYIVLDKDFNFVAKLGEEYI